MAVLDSDIKYYRSENDQLGGPIDLAEEMIDTVITDLFDKVAAQEAYDGHVDYRCIYIRNESATDTLLDPVAFIPVQPDNSSIKYYIGLGTSDVDGSEPPIDDENTEPGGVTFTLSPTANDGILLTDLDSMQHRAIWLKREVAALTPSRSSDRTRIGVLGETA